MSTTERDVLEIEALEPIEAPRSKAVSLLTGFALAAAGCIGFGC